MRLTGFTLTDATDLEKKEGPIPGEVEKKMDSFLRLSSVEDLFDVRPCTFSVLSIGIEPIYSLICQFHL